MRKLHNPIRSDGMRSVECKAEGFIQAREACELKCKEPEMTFRECNAKREYDDCKLDCIVELMESVLFPNASSDW